MNAVQKVAVFVAAVLLVGVLLLHNPWFGYVTTKQGFFLGSTYVDVSGDLPIVDWHSADPLIPWFGSLVNCLIISTAVIGLAGLWCYLFRSSHGDATG